MSRRRGDFFPIRLQASYQRPYIVTTFARNNARNKEHSMSDIQITVHDRAGRRCASSGSKWEPLMGYSRAVRSGNTIAVTGSVGVNADGSYDPSLCKQTARSLAIIKAAIEALGGKIEHVIRTRIYVTDVSKWEEVARVHGEVFKDIRPATTIVEVARLIDAHAQIEIEADAIVP
jgi:enamine deaminase RidA (YjgF/YER057c/UK114 family)